MANLGKQGDWSCDLRRGLAELGKTNSASSSELSKLSVKVKIWCLDTRSETGPGHLAPDQQKHV